MVSQQRRRESHEEEPAIHAPRLSHDEESKAEEGSSLGAHVIHEIIRREGEDELKRPFSSLAWSGLAAGLSMGFSFLAEAILKSALPDERWATLVSKLGYSVGFVIVIMGSQQLYTENTLTAVLPVMARRGVKTLLSMLRLWTIVLIANLVGAFLFAMALRHTDVLDQHVLDACAQIGRRATDPEFSTILIRGIFAGWLIAMTVWILPEANFKLGVIILLTWLVGAAELSHVIAGSIEAMYTAFIGDISWPQCFVGYILPAFIGNTIGGVTLVAGLNHAQVIGGRGERALQR